MPSNDLPSDNVASGHIAVGRVLSPHGLHGEINIEPLTTQPEHLATGRRFRLEGVEHEVEASRWRKSLVLLKLSGIDDVDAVEALRGRLLSVPESELASLPEGEYYTYQIVGLEVFDGDGERLGKVIRLFPTGSNDVYVVEGPRGEILLPAVDDVIVEVDVEGGRMVVSLMDGMLPERHAQ
jgi:16S rRNA processing protein RimM